MTSIVEALAAGEHVLVAGDALPANPDVAKTVSVCVVDGAVMLSIHVVVTLTREEVAQLALSPLNAVALGDILHTAARVALGETP